MLSGDGTNTHTHMCRCPYLYLGPECVGVALKDGLHSRLAHRLTLLVVEAAEAVAVVAVAAAGKALAVPVMGETQVCVVQDRTQAVQQKAGMQGRQSMRELWQGH